MATPNDTDGAKLTEGYRIKHGHQVLGSGERLHREYGKVEYDAGDEEYREATLDAAVRGGFIQRSDIATPKKDKPSNTKRSRQLGLPRKITGNPLGCGCSEAFLVGATKPVSSHIEADYMCDSGWHNFVVFEIVGFEDLGSSTLKINANGDIEEVTGVEVGELKDF